jgi:D-sedoheptulose 7-phosphate isomerase
MKNEFLDKFFIMLDENIIEIKTGIDTIQRYLLKRPPSTIYACGNGGSAATSDHFVNDLSSNGINAVSLCSNYSYISAIANDYGYENIFTRQIRWGELSTNDVIFAFSVSGMSKNIIKLFSDANDRGVMTIGILGSTGGDVDSMSIHSIVIESDLNKIDFMLVESIHSMIAHCIANSLIEGGLGER